jgi:AcrR family transcriptional regulator
MGFIEEKYRQLIFTSVLERAKLGVVDGLTLEEVAIAAGVPLEEVHRHATSTHEILQLAIADMLTALADAYEVIVANDTSPVAAGIDAQVAILSHVVEYVHVYRAPSSGPLWRTLTYLLREHFLAHLRQSAPRIAIPSASDRDIRMTAAFVAAGTTASMEAWIQDDDLSDLEDAVSVIFANTPHWWLEQVR